MSCSLSLFASCARSAVHHVLALWSHYVLALVSSGRIMCSLLWLYYVRALVALCCSLLSRDALALVVLCARSCRIMLSFWLHYALALLPHYVLAQSRVCS